MRPVYILIYRSSAPAHTFFLFHSVQGQYPICNGYVFALSVPACVLLYVSLSIVITFKHSLIPLIVLAYGIGLTPLSMDNIQSAMDTHRLLLLANNFRDNGYDMMEILTGLSESTLDIMSIKMVGHRDLLLRKTKDLIAK